MLVTGAAIGVAHDPFWCGVCLGPKPAGDVHGQYQSAVGRSGQWPSQDAVAEPTNVDPAVSQARVEPAMASAMLREQG